MKLWLRIDSDYPRDPRVGRLAAELRIPLHEALGKVLIVHCSMAEHAPDGDLSDIPDETINGWVGWPAGTSRRATATFAHAFRQFFLAEDGVDESYAFGQAKLNDRAEKQRERTRLWRERKKLETQTVTPDNESQDANRMHTATPKFAPTERNVTERPTKKKKAKGSASDEAAPRSSGLDVLPKADCDQLFELWTSRRGVIAYGRFRKTILLLFQAGVTRYPIAELREALVAYADWVEEQPDKEQSFCTLERFVSEIAKWVRFGKMPLVEGGEMTERGQWAGSRELRGHGHGQGRLQSASERMVWE